MADQKIIFSMVRVGKAYSQGRSVLKDISLSFFYGAKIGVLGLNGAGKSTLLKIIAGTEQGYEGEITVEKAITFGYLSQEPELDATCTVGDIVRQGVARTAGLLSEYQEVSEALGNPEADIDALLEQQAALQEKIEHLDAWDLDSKLEQAMDALRCPPAETPVSVLSGGERRRVALCRLLLQEPDVLLLDEPTNHLDAESVAWLEQHLSRYPGTILAVTHDRYFLDNVAEWILELDRGEGIPFRGNYSSWLEQKKARLEQEEKEESRRQRTLARELEWIRQNPKGRTTKSKARISAYEQLLAEEGRIREDEVEIFIPPGPRLGETVIVAEGLTKRFGSRVLFEDLTFRIPKGGIVGIIGPNGAGKTTLFRIIMGMEQPDDGRVSIGETVHLGFADQSRNLDPAKSLWEEISGGEETLRLGTREMKSRAYVARFNFSGTDQQKKTGALSGGERNRVHLAKVMLAGANVLLLDEPTNDLDVNTLRALEDALSRFSGCVVVISHDRWFLDRIATHILSFHGDGRVEWFEGNYSDFEEQRTKKGDGDLLPARSRYKKLIRT